MFRVNSTNKKPDIDDTETKFISKDTTKLDTEIYVTEKLYEERKPNTDPLLTEYRNSLLAPIKSEKETIVFDPVSNKWKIVKESN